MKPIEVHYPRGRDWDSLFLSPGNLIKYRLNTGVYYSGVFLGLTPVSQYQVMRLDVLVGGRKESVNTNTIIDLEVVG